MLDLHIHTSYSDGKFSPEAILHHAANIGIRTLAFTDHDNTNGVRQALPLATALNIELIPAIEFTWSCPDWNTPAGDEDIDVLGYFIDLDNEPFRAFEQTVLHDMYARLTERCVLLTAAGYPITLEEVFVENPHYVSGLHLAFTIQRKGYADSWSDAIQIMDSIRHRVRPGSFTIEQVIEQIHQTGGIAVLAHPSVVKHNERWLDKGQIAHLAEIGLDGLEIYHRLLDEEARKYFLDFARQFDLAISGGSDLHGWSSGFEGFGEQPVTARMVDSLRKRADNS